MLGGSGLPRSQQMGNCVSSQSQAGVVEKQSASSRGRNIVAVRKAAMEKYPVPTKCRLVLNEGPGHNGTSSNAQPATTQQNDVVSNDVAQLRSKLRPPSVTRPISFQLNKGSIDSNGNIPRPSSLPRILKPELTATKIESLKNNMQPSATSNRPSAFRTVSLDSKHRTILNPPPVPVNKTSSSKDSQSGSISPSPSSMSIASSFGSNKSPSVADSGIATCSSSRSPTVYEKKSALSLKFGFKKPLSATEIKKATVDRINSANSVLHSASAVSKIRIPAADTTRLVKQRPNSLRIAPVQAVSGSAVYKPTKMLVQQPTSRLPNSQLTMIKHRAAQVLSRSKSTDYKSVEVKPRLTVEAIVASLEQEIRHQLGPELPPLSIQEKKNEQQQEEEEKRRSEIDVERFGVQAAAKAEVTYVDEDDEDEDFIEDIELQLETPSSAAECRAQSDAEDCRDEGHQADEEDSAATSISDAMIDDEIADQPGLVMLGQSLSVPASPMHSWRSDLFHYNLPPMSTINYPLSEEDQSDASSYHHRLVRRRVASVSDIGDGLKESTTTTAAAATEVATSPVADPDVRATMRAELYNSPTSRHRDSWPEATIVIDLEEYTTMANELADIKSQLITLQNLLVESVPDGVAMDAPHGAPLWDLKRDLVLLREELQEKNMTIKTLKNELRAASGRSLNKDCVPSRVASCNVATQTDRPRSGVLTNGLSPTDNDEVQLVSTKLKMPAVSGLPIRTRPVRLTTK